MNRRKQDGPGVRALLELRAGLSATIRAFFAARGVLEVDTPAMSPAADPNPAIEPIPVTPASLDRRPHYLHTSPELPMKRLLAAGSGDIYQLCRVFRDGELGRWHEPEFLLLEWYRLGFDEHALMDEVLTLLRECLAPHGISLGHERLTYAEAFGRFVGVDPHSDASAVARGVTARLSELGIDTPADTDTDALLDLALSLVVAPALPRDAAVFIHDYPIGQASLAAIDRTATPPVAARFEIFVNGIELGNGFRELTDAAEQRSRFEADLDKRRAIGAQTSPLDESFLDALSAGLPDCAGVAIGIDRLAAIAAGADRLADVLAFPHADRPRESRSLVP